VLKRAPTLLTDYICWVSRTSMSVHSQRVGAGIGTRRKASLLDIATQNGIHLTHRAIVSTGFKIQFGDEVVFITLNMYNGVGDDNPSRGSAL
jgi:hypothetical protein